MSVLVLANDENKSDGNGDTESTGDSYSTSRSVENHPAAKGDDELVVPSLPLFLQREMGFRTELFLSHARQTGLFITNSSNPSTGIDPKQKQNENNKTIFTNSNEQTKDSAN